MLGKQLLDAFCTKLSSLCGIYLKTSQFLDGCQKSNIHDNLDSHTKWWILINQTRTLIDGMINCLQPNNLTPQTHMHAKLTSNFFHNNFDFTDWVKTK